MADVMELQQLLNVSMAPRLGSLSQELHNFGCKSGCQIERDILPLKEHVSRC